MNLTWHELWEANDKSLIISWEVGRALAQKKPLLAVKAKRGELPNELEWKGGTGNTAPQVKYGSFLVSGPMDWLARRRPRT